MTRVRGALSIWLQDATKSTFVLRASRDQEDVTEQATWTSSNPQVLVLDPQRPGIVGAGLQGGGVVTARLGALEDAWILDVWDGVLTHLGAPKADSPPHLVLGIECRLRVPIDSSPTNSYDGHELLVTTEPADVARIIPSSPGWRVRALRPGRVTIRARYGHARAERTYDVQEDALVLKDISVQDSSARIHRLWIGEPVDAWADLTSESGRFVFEGSNVRWSSTDPVVLAVAPSPRGAGAKLTGLAHGRAQVVAEWGRARKAADVLVSERPEIEYF